MQFPPIHRVKLWGLDGTDHGELTGFTGLTVDAELSRVTVGDVEVPVSADPIARLLAPGNPPIVIAAYRYDPFASLATGAGVWQIIGAGRKTNATVAGVDGALVIQASWAGSEETLQFRIVDNEAGDGRKEHGLSAYGIDRAKLAAYWIRFSSALDGVLPLRAPSDLAINSGLVTFEDSGGMKRLYDAIGDLTNGAAGMEWIVDPVDQPGLGRMAVDAQGPYWGVFRCAPWLGVDRSTEILFEYGGGLDNADGMDITGDESQLANVVSHVLAGDRDYVVSSSRDYRSIAEVGVREIVADAPDVVARDLRTELVNSEVAIAAQERLVSSITPGQSHMTGLTNELGDMYLRAPIPFIEYGLGDRIRGRMYDRGVAYIEGVNRVYGIKLSVNQLGEESVALGLYE